MNLADLMRERPDEEPRRDQTVLFDGRPVKMLATLDLTAVLELKGERVLVQQRWVEVPDPEKLVWQKRGATARDAFIRSVKERTARANAVESNRRRRP